MTKVLQVLSTYLTEMFHWSLFLCPCESFYPSLFTDSPYDPVPSGNMDYNCFELI